MTTNLIAAPEAAEGPMQVEVTPTDRDAAREYCRQYPSNGGGNFDALCLALARHRIAAEKAIVDWLNDQSVDKQDREWMGPLDVADAIERGEHKEPKQ